MINLAFKRKPKKRVVSRSFRVRPEIDRALDEEARKRDWSKSFLIQEIIRSWFTFHKASKKVEPLPKLDRNFDNTEDPR